MLLDILHSRENHSFFFIQASPLGGGCCFSILTMEVLQSTVCFLPLCKSETKLCQQHVGGKAHRADTSSGLWRSSQLTDSQHSSALTADGKLLSPLSSLRSTFLPSQLLLCLPG